MNFENLKKFNGVVFDLDGTLVNSMPWHIKAWKETVKEYGVDLDENWLYAHGGVPSFKIARHIISSFGLDNINEHELAELKTKNYLQNIHRVEIYPVMKELLVFLRNENIPMAIGTGTLRSNAEIILNNTDLHNYISVIVSADDVVNHKPHPDTFLQAAKRIGVSPKNSVVFEDTPLGIIAAVNGGFNTIFVKNGVPEL